MPCETLQQSLAVVPCIKTSLCLFLGCVLLIHSSSGWFCGRLGHWVACSLQLFICHAFVGRLASLIQKDGIRNERGPVGLGNTAFEGLVPWSQQSHILMHQMLRSWKGHAPPKLNFVTKKFVNEGSITKFTKILCHENLELLRYEVVSARWCSS